MILATSSPRDFTVSDNGVSQQLLLSWRDPGTADRQILLYQYCYVKVGGMNEICINATDNYTKSATVTNLGWSFFSYCKEYKTYPFKHQPHKMVKYNQTISRQ